TAATPFERFIERWNVDSGPITFYLTNEIPAEYRATVKRGTLAWNDASAKGGPPNAIVVKDPPSDPAFDPDDARYTTVRWITSDSSDFSAYSPHVSDPDTGQLIRATAGRARGRPRGRRARAGPARGRARGRLGRAGRARHDAARADPARDARR